MGPARESLGDDRVSAGGSRERKDAMTGRPALISAVSAAQSSGCDAHASSFWRSGSASQVVA
jgi:hypothetical protein